MTMASMDIAAMLFSAGAALLWFPSAVGDLPPLVPYFDKAPPTDPLYMSLKRSARLNRWAAGFSGLAAAAMAVSASLAT
jgi:hypothetical protein